MFKVIGFEKRNIILTLAFILLVLAHLIHIFDNKYTHLFQMIFLISYIFFIYGTIIENKKINIINILSRTIIMILVSLGMFLDYKNIDKIIL
jgi:hypothetical protein